jgi:hypothetical protein
MLVSGGAHCRDAMNFSLIDAGGLVLSVVSYVPLLLGPGAALAAFCGARGLREAKDQQNPAMALLAGLAIMPLLDSLAIRFLGLNVAAWLNLTLSVFAAAFVVRRNWRRPLSRSSLVLLAIWLAIVMVETIDFDVCDGLYEPLTVIDMVKHAATTQAIHDGGAPPYDPFFLRPDRVSYYYFFYSLTALSQFLCGGLADARMTVAGLIFWTGIGLYALIRILLERCCLLSKGATHQIRTIILALILAGGLDILAVTRLGLDQGFWLPEPTWWNEQVAQWLQAFLWVPHHVVGLIASFVGFIALSEGLTASRRQAARAVIVAGLCFASALGLSVWVTLGAVATVGLWLIAVVIERRWRAAALLLLAGLVAVLAAAPQLLDLRTGRGGDLPIMLSVRAFAPSDALFSTEPLQSIARIICLPLSYFAEFGVLFSGTLLFWRQRRPSEVHKNELARVLTFGAIAGVILGSFFRSTLFNNDLGWRVMMFPLLAASIWSAAVVERAWAERPELSFGRLWRALPASFLLLLGLGYVTTLYALVSARAYYFMRLRADMKLFVADPPVDRALRSAYAWANENLPRDAVLQHSPSLMRSIDYGLYSRNRVSIGDSYGSLFGADSGTVDARLLALQPIYTQDLAEQRVRAVAHANGVDQLIVTSDDPIWTMPQSWLWRATPLYTSANLRIVPVAALKE